MLIKPIEENVYDIFLGNGWLNWVRVKMEPKGVIVTGKSEHIQLTDKLLELIFYKVRKYVRA